MSKEINKNQQKSTLSVKQEEAIVLLSQGNSVTEISKIVECDRSTIYKWLDIPEFADKVEYETSRIVAKVKESHRSLLPLCDKALRKALEKGDIKAVELIYKTLKIIGGDDLEGNLIIVVTGDTPLERIGILRKYMRQEIRQIPQEQRNELFN